MNDSLLLLLQPASDLGRVASVRTHSQPPSPTPRTPHVCDACIPQFRAIQDVKGLRDVVFTRHRDNQSATCASESLSTGFEVGPEGWAAALAFCSGTLVAMMGKGSGACLRTQTPGFVCGQPLAAGDFRIESQRPTICHVPAALLDPGPTRLSPRHSARPRTPGRWISTLFQKEL
ncbi:hypothetical protein Micbo1qcDRAFT_156960, partial [Microdochium bolleyi]